ncbi:phage tail tape measure protein [Serratia ureilytica]|uniref:phage tail tape measure protein n=1 Tax=Serratia ureilytica TaxID=300181 RepID=UPI003FA703D5
MKQLDFTLSLIDKLTRPLKQAQASVTGFAEKSQAAFGKIAVGGAGLVGVGLSIKGALGPAIEITDALNAAATKGIDDSTLQKVAGDALAFAAKYGKSSVDFITSTEAIRSQVGLLTNQELPAFAVATNTLAAATKASGAEAAEYMGSMYNKFSSYAEKMGRVNFAEQLAGKTAYMVKAFGTNMGAISDLMEGARGVGANYGVGIDEQLAVMGQLERTLGSEASSVYESFYQTAQDGAKKLGMSFVNTAGGMVSLPEMLEKLQARYGKSIEGNLKAQAALDDAFGDSAVLIKQLYGNVDLLKRHITELGSNDGMKRATEMAERMANPWERLTAIWYSIRAAMGLTLLPVLYPMINKMADAGQTLVRWLKLFPNLARAIGLAVLAFLSLAAAGAIANLAIGVHMFLMLGLRNLLGPVAKLLGLNRLAMLAGGAATAVFNRGLVMLRAGLLAASIAARTGAVSFLLMSWPIALLVAAIGAVVAAVWMFWKPIKAFVSGFIAGFKEAAGALSPFAGAFDLVKRAAAGVWDAIKTLFGWFVNLLTPVQSTAAELQAVTTAGQLCGQIVAGAIGLLLSPIELVIKTVGHLFDAFGIVKQGWLDVVAAFDPSSPIESFMTIGRVVSGVFTKLWGVFRSAFADTYNWIIEKINMLPGVSIDPMHVDVVPTVTEPQGMVNVPPVTVPAIDAGALPTGLATLEGSSVLPAAAQAAAVAPVAVPQPAPALMPAAGARKTLIEDVSDPIVVPRAMQGTAATPAPAVPVVKVPQPPAQQVQVLAQVQTEKSAPPPPAPDKLLSGGRLKGIGPGGINKEINNNSRTITDNRKNIENVHINVKQGMTPEQLMEWQELS